MAIQLSGLNATEITSLSRPQVKQTSYRLNADKIKNDWEKLKSEGKDMIQISKESATYHGDISVDEIKPTGEVRRTECNYSLEAFFRKDMPQITTDGGYMVGGAYFSKEELEQCRRVMQTATDSMGCGIGKNTNLDYKNYAEMGIAVSTVKKFASENLTEEQAAVVNRAMQEYNDALVNMEQDVMSDGTYIDSPYKEMSDYYGKVKVLSDTEIDAINQLKKELGRLTGRYYEPSKWGMTSVVQSATNQELTGKIKDLFSNLDYTDSKAVDAAMEQYKEWMKPAYNAYGIGDTDDALAGVLNKDVAGFKKQLSDILMLFNYHKTDYSI